MQVIFSVWQTNIQATTSRTRFGDIVSLRRIPKCKNRVVIYATFTSEKCEFRASGHSLQYLCSHSLKVHNELLQ